MVGFLNVASVDVYRPMVAAFRQGLQRSGYVEGQNVLIEYRWAANIIDCPRWWPIWFIVK